MWRVQGSAVALLIACLLGSPAGIGADDTPGAKADLVPSLPGHGNVDFGLYSG